MCRMGNKANEVIDLLRKKMFPLLGSTESLADHLKKSPVKSTNHCVLYHQITKSPEPFTCPWPSECVHKREDRPEVV